MGQKILVVEDNELNLKLFCDLLRAHGYQAEPVRDGREAVERARGFAPDLIVMDIQMPHVSGLELIEQLKGDPELRMTPIMAVTAYAAKGDEERIREAGAEGYVSKPISVLRFVEAVRALLAAPRPEAPAGPAEPVRASRRFDSPAETVFDSWLLEGSVGEWLFATPDGESVRAGIEPHVGGRFEIVERRGGEEIHHTGRYEEMARPLLLAFTLQVPKYSENEERVRIEITPSEDGGCELALTQTLSANAPASAEQIAKGWETILEALAKRLDGRNDGKEAGGQP